MFKLCIKCGTEQSLDSYSKDIKAKDGKKRYCKSCCNKYFKNWRNSNLQEIREIDRKNHYRRAYNLPEDIITKLIDNRNGICAICKEISPLVVDHNHKTGKVRDLICSSCNSLLGYSKENLSTLSSAIEYLKYHV